MKKGIWASLFLAAAMIAGGGASVSAQSSSPAAPQGEAKAPTIPSRPGVWGDIIYGDENAPVELIEYGSLTCPACASFATEVVPRLMEDFVSKGQLKFVFRNFVRDRYDLAAASASRCIADEEGAKAALDDLFKEQESWMSSDNPYQAMAGIVGKYGLSQEEMGQCISDREVRLHIVEMRQNGLEEHEVKATPTLVLNGVPMLFPGYDRLKLRIETQIATQALSSN